MSRKNLISRLDALLAAATPTTTTRRETTRKSKTEVDEEIAYRKRANSGEGASGYELGRA